MDKVEKFLFVKTPRPEEFPAHFKNTRFGIYPDQEKKSRAGDR